MKGIRKMKLRKAAQLATASVCTLALSFTAVGAANAAETPATTSAAGSYGNVEDIRASTVCSENNTLLSPKEQEFADVLAKELERFNNVTNIEDIKLTAIELYPDDVSKQQEYVEFSSEPLAQFYEARALPAVVAAAIPVIAACVARGLSGAALDQVVTALRGNDLARADDLIWSFAAGCVGFGPLKWAFNKAKPVAARTLTWAVQQALKVTGKFKK